MVELFFLQNIQKLYSDLILHIQLLTNIPIEYLILGPVFYSYSFIYANYVLFNFSYILFQSLKLRFDGSE